MQATLKKHLFLLLKSKLKNIFSNSSIDFWMYSEISGIILNKLSTMMAVMLKCDNQKIYQE